MNYSFYCRSCITVGIAVSCTRLLESSQFNNIQPNYVSECPTVIEFVWTCLSISKYTIIFRNANPTPGRYWTCVVWFLPLDTSWIQQFIFWEEISRNISSCITKQSCKSRFCLGIRMDSPFTFTCAQALHLFDILSVQNVHLDCHFLFKS